MIVHRALRMFHSVGSGVGGGNSSPMSQAAMLPSTGRQKLMASVRSWGVADHSRLSYTIVFMPTVALSCTRRMYTSGATYRFDGVGRRVRGSGDVARPERGVDAGALRHGVDRCCSGRVVGVHATPRPGVDGLRWRRHYCGPCRRWCDTDDGADPERDYERDGAGESSGHPRESRKPVEMKALQATRGVRAA